ncbi:Fibrocystin-L [Mactra antiquata]
MPDDTYRLLVAVGTETIPDIDMCNGDAFADDCVFKPDMEYTPTIQTLTPNSGLPGTLVTMQGRIISDKYGSNKESATNGKIIDINRVYVGPVGCDLKDGDNFHGLFLDGEDSDDGYITCKHQGKSIGFYNASFILEAPYGRSIFNENRYKVSYSDDLYMFQTYTSISSISHSSGSTEGGLVLTIYGDYFDGRAPYSPPLVYVGDEICDIIHLEIDEYISCVIKADPGYTHTQFPGSRGVLFETWSGQGSSSLDSIVSFSSGGAGYSSTVLDETYYNDTESMDDYASRMTTLFTPPQSGEYQFHLEADDEAKLYINGVAVVTSTGVWAASDRMDLNKENRYLLSVVHRDTVSDSFVHLKVKFFDHAKFTKDYTGNAVQELQIIRFTSTVVWEKQRVTFTPSSITSADNDEQTLTIRTGDEFRIGIFDTYTKPLSTSTSETDIQNAINALPVFGPEESVLVTRMEDATPKYSISITSKRGEFPDFEVISLDGSKPDYSIERTTPGTPDDNTASLLFSGRASQPFPLNTLSQANLETIVSDMFEARCPSVVESPQTKTFYQSYEPTSTGDFTGQVVKDTEPFCGRYVLKNPWRAYKKGDTQSGISLTTNQWACFAYKGFFQDVIGLKFTYKSADDGLSYDKTEYFTFNFLKDTDTVSESWYYNCTNIYNWIIGRRPGTSHVLTEFRLYRLSDEQPGFVDALYFGQAATTTDTDLWWQVQRPSMPNGAIINEVTVSEISATEYDIVLNPYECGNTFPLFMMANSEIAGDASKSNEGASLTASLKGGISKLDVTRINAASPPVTGTIDIMYDQKRKEGLNVSIEAGDYRKQLQSIQGIGALEVEKDDTCDKFDVKVTFKTLPGDVSEMSVTGSQLDGIDASAEIFTAVDGGLYYDPLTGDMTSLVYDKPQVRTFINNVPALCADDCTFEWLSASTPTVTGVAPSSGTLAQGTSAVIGGTGFNTDPTQNYVTIAGISCSVTASTSTSITCSVGNGPVGDHKVEVNVAGKGIAKHSSGDVMFEYTARIDDVNPKTSSLGGGIPLTITGYGFKTTAVITINDNICEHISNIPSEIICRVPHSTTIGPFNVVVSQGTINLSFASFTYDDALTATVSSFNPSTMFVQGGELTIVGSNFLSVEGSVYIGDVPCEVALWTDTDIVARVPLVNPGVSNLYVQTSYGMAVNTTNKIPGINIDLSVTKTSPKIGSLQGGTILTITGTGFGTDTSLVDVDVGDIDCEISDLTNTEIQCIIGDAGTVHYVTNKGSHPDYGIYYEFDQPYSEINEGDYVYWTFELPAIVTNVNFSVIEVDSPSSRTPKDGGFASATGRNVEFKQQFPNVGTYYVWSGMVDNFVKEFYGTVEVKPAYSHSQAVSVTVSGVESLYETTGSSNSISGSSCPDWQIPDDDSRFYFTFSSCNTPHVSAISQNNGTVETTISVYGDGFCDNNCVNEVTFGGHPCEVLGSSDEQIDCKLARSGEPELGVILPVAVKVGNIGNALVTIDRKEESGFGVIPNIRSFSPSTGSTAGGALVTIDGFGFGDSPIVEIGGYQCEVTFNTYTEIICETPAVNGEFDVEVKAEIENVGSLPAVCETSTRSCKYVTASIWTPTVNTITPDSLSADAIFTITGEDLGEDNSIIEINIGGETATVIRAQNTFIEASITNLPAGVNDVFVRVGANGKADGNLLVYSEPSAVISPSSGSIYGNTLASLSGNGFVEDDTNVTMDGIPCVLESVSLSTVTFYTPALGSAVSSTVEVVSNGVQYPSTSFSYSTSSTPTVTSVSPSSGLPGGTLTISGTNLDSGAATVDIGGSNCPVISSTSSQILCTAGEHETGSAPISVHVDGLGDSNDNVEFQYELTFTGILPVEGGIAGGQTVVLTGTGFSETASVTICGQHCAFKETSFTEYICRTPANSAQVCNVEVAVGGLTQSLTNAYTYDSSLTPTISSVDPTRGGTGGGTTLTITGSGFGNVAGSVSVSIDDAECIVNTVSDTEIVCVTGEHPGSVDKNVEVQVAGNGIAQEASPGDSWFSYIDVWSSSFTWGGGPLPEAGDFIVIPSGMTILLDTDTPVLSFLLIQGGKLIFDEKDVELQSKVIMITDGGLFQVGTEEVPFQHKAIITLHGHHRDPELPIYGTKVLAVRNGTLDLHGIETSVTWTRLAATASSGSYTISLESAVDWNVGDEIVMASTGGRHSQSENEKKTIAAISHDGRTLTLETPLEADHFGVEEVFDGTTVEFRGEVGLLTHNVVVRGNQDIQWNDEITACEDGFDTGEFATQTCFQGRFGDEIGSSQFGAMILVHAPEYDTHMAQAKISYTEVTFAGQAFRLGRYPIHFHLNGDMSTSYVKGCGIHHTFNRAVNIHGTHNTLVEKTVIYNIMGGAFFLEDGIETGNKIQNNLAVFVRESSSLLNDDITPASFWVTNPNNTIRNNAAAGGTHFGYWYRMHDHPEGPSYTETVCPKNTPLGEFSNNSAHSFGWFGLWIFPDYFPLKGGCGGIEAEPAVFDSLFAWNCEKGAEGVNSGALQFKNFVLANNEKAGYEGKLIVNAPQGTNDSPMIANSLIIAKATVMPDDEQVCTNGGLIFPYGSGFRAEGNRFVNFDENDCVAFRWTRIDGTCSVYCGAYSYHTQSTGFINSPNKAAFEWEFEGVIYDEDGSILPDTPTVPDDCTSAPEYSIGIPAVRCPPQYKWHRYSFNNPLPASLEGKNVLLTNQFGSSSSPFAQKRITHKYGWAVLLLGGEIYDLKFQDAELMQNFSFTGQFYDFEASDYVYLRMLLQDLPDRFSIDGGKNYINRSMDISDGPNRKNGDWEWDNVKKEIRFIVHGQTRSKRGASMASYDNDRPYSFSSFKCFYPDCIPPPDPDTIPPAKSRPLDFEIWDSTLWNLTEDGYIVNEEGSSGVPADYDNVRIAAGTWVVVDQPINKLGTLIVEGVLEFNDSTSAVYDIEADHIIIKGGRLIIGWEDNAFDGTATITLRGNGSAPYFDIGDGPVIGARAIGVFGGLDLFGKDNDVPWTMLAETAEAGSNEIVLSQEVDWSIGDEIVVGPTSLNAWQTEYFQISSIASDGFRSSITLDGVLSYRHKAFTESVDATGWEFTGGAVVGLLTRNIKIIGQEYDGMYEDSYGARVIVGLVTEGESIKRGYARLSNVEFYHTGQEGFTEEYDPRFSLAFLNTGTVDNVKPSSVTKCSFHHSFSTGIGVFGTNGLNVTDNIVTGSVGHGYRTSADGTSFINNLCVLMIATNSYQDRYEPYNFRYEACFEALTATALTLIGNVAAGSERVGFHVPFLDCEDNSGRYVDNYAFSSMIGVMVLPDDPLTQSVCTKVANFTVWKNQNFGIYYQNPASLVVDNCAMIDNTNGLFTIVMGPPSLDHLFANKYVNVQSSTFVGQSSGFDVDIDEIDKSDDNYKLAAFAIPSNLPNGGMSGLVVPNFMSATNNAPGKPFRNAMSYNSIGGLTTVSDVTFAKFGTTSGKKNYAIATNIGNDDLQHPIEISGSTLSNVELDNKVFFHRPNVGKVNGADCVDMDCDAFKKTIVKDTDGTFLGHVGTVIPEAEYEWDGDPRHGVGDYRIPKELLTSPEGDRVDINDIITHRGIIRNDNCIYQASWHAYECMDDLDYQLLVIESMDADTETRRLSPVAVLGNSYIDLINGPQDHGWCSGYTCRLRVSLFHALVATGEEYKIHFTGVSPKNMRLRMLNADSSEKVMVSLWYSSSNRLDLYVDDTYMAPTNARDDNGNTVYDPPKDEHQPLIDDAIGTNLFDRNTGYLNLIVGGDQVIDIKTAESVIISFGLPAMSVDDFFGDNLVTNLASFLNIPLNKIKVVNVVSASGNRRRRSTDDSIVVTMEISDEPASNINVTVSGTLDYATLLQIASDLVNECQVGNISETLNITGSCEQVQIVSDSLGEDPIVYNTPSPDHLFFHTTLQAEFEGSTFVRQPKIRAADISNAVVTELGTAEYPWELTASIRSGTGHPNAMLNGTTTVNCTDGWFNFTDLEISHMGNNYILDFNVTFPSEAENFTLESAPFNVSGRPVEIHVYDRTSGNIVRSSRFSVTIDLLDSNTNEIISDLAWRDHTWSAEAKMLGSPTEYGSLDGTLTSSFDPSTGRAMFPDLNITGFGMFYVQFRVVSNPPDYNLTLNHKLNIMHPNHVGMIIEDTYEVEVKFDVDFDRVLPTEDKQAEFEQMILTDYANRWPDIQLSTGSIRKGSIMVTFDVSGSNVDVNDTAYSVCELITNGTIYSFNGYDIKLSGYMTVDSQAFYGVSCAIKEEEDDDDGMEGYLIAIIVILCVLVVVVISGIIIWRFVVKPKTQTTGWNNGFFHKSDKSIEDFLFKSQKGHTVISMDKAPISTSIGGQRQNSGLSDFSLRINTPVQSPTPTTVKNVQKRVVEPADRSESQLSIPTVRREGSQTASISSGRESPLTPVGTNVNDSIY